MNLNLEGKCAIVTGGTRNLGEAIVRGLLTEGAYVIATYLSDDEAAQTMQNQAHAAWGAKLRVEKRDASCAEHCDLICETANRLWGRLDLLVNNAAVILSQPIDNVTDADFDRVLHNSLRSMLYMSRSAFRIMRRQGAGRIVNISTAGVQTANPNEILYLCAKAGVEAATRAFARMGGPFGVTANAVAPHVIGAGMGSKTLLSDPTIISRIPLGRTGEIEEFVSTVLFLCSDKAQYLNGQIVGLNGGRLMS